MVSVILLAVLAVQSGVAVPDAAPPPGPGSSTAHATPATLVAATPLVISIDATLSSKTAVIGSTFPISLAEPLTVAGVTIPAGIRGEGEVIHAAKPGAAGRAGELILAARWLQWGDIRIPVRRLRFGQHGTNNQGAALATGIAVGVIGFAITGGDVLVPAGSRADVIVSANVPLSPSTNERK